MSVPQRPSWPTKPPDKAGWDYETSANAMRFVISMAFAEYFACEGAHYNEGASEAVETHFNLMRNSSVSYRVLPRINEVFTTTYAQPPRQCYPCK